MSIDRIHKGKSIIDVPRSYVVIDIETTGLSPVYDEIIEVGAIKIQNGQIIDTFESLIKPSFKPWGNYIDEFIEELTGITNEMLADAPDVLDIFPKFLEFIDDNIIIGHNVNFDINFQWQYLYNSYSYLGLRTSQHLYHFWVGNSHMWSVQKTNLYILHFA